jgi:hypothetical protein
VRHIYSGQAIGGLASGHAMAALRAGETGAGQSAVPQGQGGHGGGRHIAFGGQQMPLA